MPRNLAIWTTLCAAGALGVGCGPRSQLLGTIDSNNDGSTVAPAASYLMGADITFVQADEASGATYSDGMARDIIQILKDHGFNAIRTRTFVDPRAADGYDPAGSGTWRTPSRSASV
jgi:hypothetical protein